MECIYTNIFNSQFGEFILTNKFTMLQAKFDLVKCHEEMAVKLLMSSGEIAIHLKQYVAIIYLFIQNHWKMCADFAELVKIIWIAIGYVAIMIYNFCIACCMRQLYHSYVLQVQYDLCQRWYHLRCIERQLKGNVVGDGASERVSLIGCCCTCDAWEHANRLDIEMIYHYGYIHTYIHIYSNLIVNEIYMHKQTTCCVPTIQYMDSYSWLAI